MFIRVEHWLTERRMSTYELAQQVKALGVSDQAVYRLVRAKGRLKRIDMRLLAALCHVFDVDAGDLLERDQPAAASVAPKKKRRR